MAMPIIYRDREVMMNNAQFGRMVDLAIETARRSRIPDSEKVHLHRLEWMMNNGCLWPGRCVWIEEDFPDLEERKFWARIFLDTARFLFDREIGIHEHSFWQAQTIYLAYGVGCLFMDAVREEDRRWMPDTIDFLEEDEHKVVFTPSRRN